jgi:uncharacterized protein YjbJ (UPF0337 family)
VKDKAKGRFEEIKGRVTGDRVTEARGKARQTVGEARRVARDVREETAPRPPPRRPRRGRRLT